MICTNKKLFENLISPQKKYQFLPYQANWICDNSKKKLWVKSRQIGATYTQAFATILNSVDENIRRNSFFQSNNEDNGVFFINYLRDHCEKFAYKIEIDKLLKKDNIKEIRFLNGVLVFALSSASGQLRGKQGNIILDEFAYRQDCEDVMKSAIPITTWGGGLSILSSVNGDNNLFWELYQDAMNNEGGWSLHKTTIDDAVEQGLGKKVNNKLTNREFIDDLRNKVADDYTWQEEYLCNPVNNRYSFINNIPLVVDSFDAYSDGGVYVGIDVGRSNNHTSVWVQSKKEGEHTLLLHDITKLDKVSFEKQFEQLKFYLSKYNVRKISIDKTGIGQDLYENILNHYGDEKVNGVQFTQNAKYELAIKCKDMLLNNQCKVKNEKKYIADIYSITQNRSKSGNMSIDATTNYSDLNSHGDYFWSFALSCHAYYSKDSFIPFTADSVYVGASRNTFNINKNGNFRFF